MGKIEAGAMKKGERMELLAADELAVVQEVRKLRKEEAAWASPPAELLEHGYMTPTEAAKHLGRPAAELEKLVKAMRFPNWKGQVPRSEVLRRWEARKRDHLNHLANSVKNLVRPQRSAWLAYDSLDNPAGYNIQGIASQLGLSKAAARRLVMKDGSPLFAWKIHGRGPAIVTEEELAASARRTRRPGTSALICKRSG